MMSRLQGIIAILRLAEGRLALPVAQALIDGGIQTVEIALTTPHALVAITQVADALGDRALIGAGSIVARADAGAAIAAGARFLVTPAVRRGALAEAEQRGVRSSAVPPRQPRRLLRSTPVPP
jgi:2-keto-3-deoxy-6-phosphogluconate aldolase